MNQIGRIVVDPGTGRCLATHWNARFLVHRKRIENAQFDAGVRRSFRIGLDEKKELQLEREDCD